MYRHTEREKHLDRMDSEAELGEGQYEIERAHTVSDR